VTVKSQHLEIRKRDKFFDCFFIAYLLLIKRIY